MEFEYQKRLNTEKNERRQECKDYWDRAGAAGLWAAAIVGAAAIIFSRIDSKRQLHIMRNQIAEMQAERRAWISTTNNSGMESFFLQNGKLTGQLRVTLQNTGRNPAVFVYVAAEMSISTFTPHRTIQAWQKAVCQDATGHMGFTMFPNSREAYEISVSANLTSSTVVWPVVAACIGYRDAVTGLTHYTPLAFQVSMRVPRPGDGCCAILLKHLPLGPNDLATHSWIIGTLPPT